MPAKTNKWVEGKFKNRGGGVKGFFLPSELKKEPLDNPKQSCTHAQVKNSEYTRAGRGE